ncbi:hypothetical protein BY996DRAFT_6526249, partial [Phakopsora pachyrhizi]
MSNSRYPIRNTRNSQRTKDEQPIHYRYPTGDDQGREGNLHGEPEPTSDNIRHPNEPTSRGMHLTRRATLTVDQEVSKIPRGKDGVEHLSTEFQGLPNSRGREPN